MNLYISEEEKSGIDRFDLNIMTAPLLRWFGAHARILPWREKPLPYYVWISEIMLQQTRVEAVKPYFDRFIAALPDVKALAECKEADYLKLWEGLGYYNRVRNLNAAAKQIMEDYGGVIPSDYEALLKLKGIGSYTAGAVSSIAYGKPEPAVDGNVLRVISRLTADASDIMKQSVRAHMEEKLRRVMLDTGADPGQLNQALMELGAVVCVPNGTPHCEACPWKDICLAKQQDLTGVLPVKKKQKARRTEDLTVFIIRDGAKVALKKRPEKGLLAGLYELPNTEGHLTQEEALAYMKKQGFGALRIRRMQDAKHIFTHVEWHMISYQVIIEEPGIAEPPAASGEKAGIAETSAVSGENAGIAETEGMRAAAGDPASPECYVWADAASARKDYAIPNAFKAFEDLYRAAPEQ